MDCHFLLQGTFLTQGLNSDLPHCRQVLYHGGFPGGSEVKASASNVGDQGSIPGLGRSPGEGNGNPLQYSCLENPMDGGAWLATVHGVAKSRTRLSNFTITLTIPQHNRLFNVPQPQDHALCLCSHKGWCRPLWLLHIP